MIYKDQLFLLNMLRHHLLRNKKTDRLKAPPFNII